MSLFKNLFNSENQNSSKQDFNWIQLNSKEQLQTILKDSHTNPQLIFKHSTRCFTSSMAKKEFEKMYNDNETLNFYFLNVITDRNLSNEVAERFKVRHESPQLLIIEEGQVSKHASHSDIMKVPVLTT